MLLLLTLYLMLSFVSWVVTGNETGSPSGVLIASLDLRGTIISNLNCSHRSQLTKELFLVIIESLIVFNNGHENMVLYATPSPRARENVTRFTFTTNGVL